MVNFRIPTKPVGVFSLFPVSKIRYSTAWGLAIAAPMDYMWERKDPRNLSCDTMDIILFLSTESNTLESCLSKNPLN